MPAIVSKLKRKLKAGDTEERCGLILEGGKIITAPNIHPEPTNGFMIDPSALLLNEQKMIGTWHTHPNGQSVLSAADHQGFRQWPNLTHYVIGEDGVRAYEVEDGLVLEVSCS